MYDQALLPVSWVYLMRTHNQFIESNVLEMILNKNEIKNNTLNLRTVERTRAHDLLLNDLKTKELSPKAQELLGQYEAILPKYRAQLDKVRLLGLENKDDEAYEIFVDSVSEMRDQTTALLTEISNEVGAKAEAAKASAAQQAQTAGVYFLVVIVAAAALLSVIGFWIILLITRPLKSLTQLMERAKDGDLTVEGSYRSKDEIGKITSSFNAMIFGLRQLVGKVNESSLTLSASAEEMMAGAEQTSRASEQIASSASELATAFEEQVKSVSSSSDLTEELSTTIITIDRSGEEMNQLSVNSGLAIEEGVQAISSVLQQMNGIEGNVRETQEMMSQLGSLSDEIGAVVITIREIAKQTNLLALNASIEAARAGEQGRGFAVVASEIRKLAEGTAASTEKITEVVETIQSQISVSLESTMRGSESVKRGVELSSQASKSFESIDESMKQLSVRMSEIGQSVSIAAASAREVAGHMAHLQAVSQEGNSSVQEVAASSQEQLASMEEMTHSSQSLSQLAEELQGLLVKFKL